MSEIDLILLDGEGDLGWMESWRELRDLHLEKSSTYGDTEDPLANFTLLGHVTDSPPERYVIERIIEKCIRSLNMIEAGAVKEIAEYQDIAGLALCAEALRRRK